MARSAMRYLLYGYIGIRTQNTSGLGIDIPAPGFRFCLYDSEQVRNESRCPTLPAIKEPTFSINENSAGSIDFTLLSDGASEVYYNPTKDGTPVVRTTTLRDINANPLPASEEALFNYILPKQTEIVLYRSIRKPNNTVECVELWAGRVDTIKKDLYNNWSVYAEGEFTYLNDVVLNETKMTNAVTSDQIMRDVISKYNERIKQIADPGAWGTSAQGIRPNITLTVPNPPAAVDQSDPQHPQLKTSTYNPPQLPRIFHIGELDDLGIPGVATSSDLDNTFSIGDGTTVMSVVQSLIDKYGGHIEITKNKQVTNSRILNWKKSGVYDESRDTYNWVGYHPFVEGTSQVIEFGVNLLDFSEEQDTSDLFTVLIPHGQAVVTTTTDSEGKTTSKTGPALTISGTGINKLRPGKEYIYYDNVVDTYGWIEKIETWNVNDANLLYQLALAYYKDLHIGARKISIKAYDLKNLVGNKQGIKNDADMLAIDALYLYDTVWVRSAAHANKKRAIVGTETPSQMMPIKGIKIPLDKFTTDTEYTISNGIAKRSILSPGSVGQKEKEKVPQPEPVPGGDNPTETTPEEVLPTVSPIGTSIGDDDDIAHHPAIYLDRAFQYITADINYHENDQEEVATATSYNKISWYVYNVALEQWINYDTRTGQPYELDIQQYSILNWREPSQASVNYSVKKFGFKGTNTSLAGGESLGSTSVAPGSVFFTDKLSAPSKATMRLRNAHENKINWFEKVYVDTETHTDTELQPFVSSNSGYYSAYAEANVTPGQVWGSYANSHIREPEIRWSQPVEFNASYDVSNIIHAIENLSFDGTTIGSILYGVTHTQLEADILAANNLELAMYYVTAATGGNEYTIRRPLPVQWRPATFEEGYKYYYVAGICTVGDAASLYYTYFKVPETGQTYDEDYWNLKIAQAKGEFVKFGFTEPTAEIDISMFEHGYPASGRYYKTVSVTYGSHTGDVYIAANQGDAGAQETTMYSTLKNRLTADIQGHHLDGLPTSQRDAFARDICQNGSGGLIGRLAQLVANRDKVYADQLEASGTSSTNVLEMVKAKNQATPFLVVCKTHSASGESDSYGVIPFLLPSGGSGVRLEKNAEHGYYTMTGSISALGPNSYGTPVMICRDTLMYNEYMFYETTLYGVTTLAFSNTSPLPLWSQRDSRYSYAPTTTMAKCGGCQTTNVANSAYFRLAGDDKTSHCYGNAVIFPQMDDRDSPGNRSMEQRATEGDHDKVWYRGSDMKRVDSYDSFVKIDADDEEELSKYYINTMGRQPLTIGGKYYVRVTPCLYLQYPQSNN